MPADVQKATTLYEECTGPQSILYVNATYKQLVEEAPLFLRLSDRDKEILETVDDDLPNHHLSNRWVDYIVLPGPPPEFGYKRAETDFCTTSHSTNEGRQKLTACISCGLPKYC